MIRSAHWIGLLLLGLIAAALGTWAVLAVSYAGPENGAIRNGIALLVTVISLGAVACLGIRRWRWRALTLHAMVSAVVILWWSSLEPSNTRQWQADVARLPYAETDGDRVTVRNIRNFDYRSETDYTPAYYDKRFDLRKLEGVDLVAAYWMGPAVAHVFVSFAFAGGDHLAVSIETRKENGESYSTLKGFFRQYELFYVVADESDVIRLRTNYRRDPPEDVYVYRMQAPIENGRRLFMEYVNRINALKDKPEFYNTLTTNCTTNIWFHSQVNQEHPPFSWKILASGFVPEYLYEVGRLDQSAPFTELRQRAHINARAQAAGTGVDFSRRIREVQDASALRSTVPSIQ